MLRKAAGMTVGACAVYVAMAACGGRIEAVADEAPRRMVVTVEEPCDRAVTTPGGVTYLYAEHAYVGRSAPELADVRALAHHRPGETLVPRPDGYGWVTAQASVRDGSVAVWCGPPDAPYYDRVTFVAAF